MNQSLFKSVVCQQCGAPLNPFTLKCTHCGTYAINWNLAELTCGYPPSLASGNRRKLTALFLNLLQLEASAKDVAITLTIGGYDQIVIWVTLKESGHLKKVAEICGYRDQLNAWYASMSFGFWPITTEIGWQKQLNGGEPLYLTRDNDYPTHDDRYSWEKKEATFKGAADLFENFGVLKTMVQRMVDRAFWEIREKEREQIRQAKITAAPRGLRWLAKLIY